MIPVLGVISVLIFGLIQIMPGDPVEIYLGPDGMNDPALVQRVRGELGLDQPIPVQYVSWVGKTLTGDLGKSINARRPVSEMILEALPKTLQLAAMTLTFAFAISLPLGIIAAIRRNTWIDWIATAVASFGAAMPSFFMGILGILLFSVTLKWIPAFGYANPLQDPGRSLLLMIMPVVTLGLSATASLTRQLRSSMVEVNSLDYVRTARAKGLSTWSVIFGHMLKNALIPVVTVLGLQFAVLVSGAVIIESLFSIPGIGRLVIQAITTKDYPVVMASTLVVAVLVLFTNLLIDLSYSWLDPRIRYS